jgi:uncharacterized protein CbrC (UPF0167 family)
MSDAISMEVVARTIGFFVQETWLVQAGINAFL